MIRTVQLDHAISLLRQGNPYKEVAAIIKTIQGYVGHKDSRTTLNNYNFDRRKKEEQSRQLTEARLSLSLSDITESVPNCTQLSS